MSPNRADNSLLTLGRAQYLLRRQTATKASVVRLKISAPTKVHNGRPQNCDQKSFNGRKSHFFDQMNNPKIFAEERRRSLFVIFCLFSFQPSSFGVKSFLVIAKPVVGVSPDADESNLTNGGTSAYFSSFLFSIRFLQLDSIWCKLNVRWQHLSSMENVSFYFLNRVP